VPEVCKGDAGVEADIACANKEYFHGDPFK
jgi:hypothetical protein